MVIFNKDGLSKMFICISFLLVLFLAGCSRCGDYDKSNPELYCEKYVSKTDMCDAIFCTGNSNVSHEGYKLQITYDYRLRNRSQDFIDSNNQKEAERLSALKEQERIDCWNNGSYYNYSFDIIKDYNLSCTKLAYINNHLIDKSRRVDGGYITGEYHGFLSYGNVEGHLYSYVTEGILATGQLIKNITYHLTCDNSTLELNARCIWDYDARFNAVVGTSCNKVYDTEIVNYYSESDFVMYYVNNCIKEN